MKMKKMYTQNDYQKDIEILRQTKEFGINPENIFATDNATIDAKIDIIKIKHSKLRVGKGDLFIPVEDCDTYRINQAFKNVYDLASKNVQAVKSGTKKVTMQSDKKTPFTSITDYVNNLEPSDSPIEIRSTRPVILSDGSTEFEVNYISATGKRFSYAVHLDKEEGSQRDFLVEKIMDFEKRGFTVKKDG
jgi:hypothetical protein